MLLEEKGRFILSTRVKKNHKIRELSIPLFSTGWAHRAVLGKAHLVKCGEKLKSLEWSNRNDQSRNMICKDRMKELDLFNVQRKSKRGTEQESPNMKRIFFKRQQSINYTPSSPWKGRHLV